MAMLNDLGGELVNPYPEVSPMLSPSGDPQLDQIRQKMFGQNIAMQNNQIPPQLSMPDTPMMEQPQSMIPQGANPMFMPSQKQPGNILEAILMGTNAPEGQDPLGTYVKGNWQDLLQSGISGLEDNYARQNLPADIYIKMKAQENEKAIAEQDRLLRNLQAQADIDYQRQSLDLKREELAMERSKVLSGGNDPAAIRQTAWYLSASPEEQAIYDRVNKIGVEKVDIGGKTIFIDKVTGQQVGEVDKTLAPADLPKTREEQAAASEKGKESGAAAAKLNAMEAAMPGLTEVTNKLRTLGKVATYTSAGQVRDKAMRELGMDVPDAATARTAYMTTIDNEVLPLLRDTFGAAFTVEEGNRLRSTLGNENMSPPEKEAALASFIDAKTREIRKLQRQTGVTVPTAPEGIDPSLFEHMTPEERALFQ